MSFSITPYHNVDGSYVDDLLRMDMCENILLELRSGGDHGMYVYPKFLRASRAGTVIHTSAEWYGQGMAVWVSHPGQVGDRAGQLCGSVRAGQCGRAGQGGQGRARQAGKAGRSGDEVARGCIGRSERGGEVGRHGKGGAASATLTEAVWSLTASGKCNGQ